MPEFVTARTKRRRADLGREMSPIKQLKSSIRTGANRRENRRHANMYRDKRWKEIRLWVLEEMPFCVMCGEAATTVDHIVPHLGSWKLFLDMQNLQPLCKPCHDKKTRVERKVPRMGARLTPFPKPRKSDRIKRPTPQES